MKIGIDISQMAYEGTGVGEYTRKLVEWLLKVDHKNEYLLFFSSLRRKISNSKIQIPNKFQIPNSKIQIKEFKMPLTVLDILWNWLHILPIEWLVGKIDVFLSSDWTQPPTVKAKKITVIHDLSPLKYPEESHSKTEFRVKSLILSPNIVEIQKRRLKWVKEECDLIICDSQATKKDAMEILGIKEERLKVVYPGVVNIL